MRPSLAAPSDDGHQSEAELPSRPWQAARHSKVLVGSRTCQPGELPPPSRQVPEVQAAQQEATQEEVAAEQAEAAL